MDDRYYKALKEIRKELDGVKLFSPKEEQNAQRESACMGINEILERFDL